MGNKTSADYQREFRKRMREQGLVKKEVWIRPDYAKQLSIFEKQLRSDSNIASSDSKTVISNDSATEVDAQLSPWTIDSLFDALTDSDLVKSGEASVIKLQSGFPTIEVLMNRLGELPIFISVVGEQILVEAMLWPESYVSDKNEFNRLMLKSHKYFPLSTLCIEQDFEGTNWYQMFGALSAFSRLKVIEIEIEMLGANVMDATESFQQYLTVPEREK